MSESTQCWNCGLEYPNHVEGHCLVPVVERFRAENAALLKRAEKAEAACAEMREKAQAIYKELYTHSYNSVNRATRAASELTSLANPGQRTLALLKAYETMYDACDSLDHFAWTAVEADCDESRNYLNSKIKAMRVALAAFKAAKEGK